MKFDLGLLRILIHLIWKGILFESNGHGNLLYKEKHVGYLKEAVKIVKDIAGNLPEDVTEAEKAALKDLEIHLDLLYNFIVLANPVKVLE